MSQVNHPTISVRAQLQAHRVVMLAALLALLATATVVLVLAIDGESSTGSSVAEQSQPALRSDGGPNESAVAASLSRAPEQVTGGPAEAATAAAISGR